MKIAIIGSTQYKDKFNALQQELIHDGHEVAIPAFDDHPNFDELQVCEYNRSIVEWADVVYIIWDNRSTGTIFDFGMAFMARKPVIVYYIEPKTFANVMRKYEFVSCFAHSYPKRKKSSYGNDDTCNNETILKD